MSDPCPTCGFCIRATLSKEATDADEDALIESLREVLEAHGLSANGGGHRTFEWAITREGDQATYADRELFNSWTSRWSHVADIRISDLIDLDQ